MCESRVRLTAVAQKDKCHVRLTAFACGEYAASSANASSLAQPGYAILGA
jgi:hypothetical protein